MGVTGLWKLIESSGKPVPVETLENKVLAIDISIWLHQVVKGYQDNKGGHVQNAHIIGLFNRICKLLYYRIKPIFVFDGAACSLKHDTIRKRSQQKSKIQTEAERIEKLLLESLAKEHVLKEKLEIASTSTSPVKNVKPLNKNEEFKDEMFMLPPTKAIKVESIKKELEEDDEWNCPKKSYSRNITSIDVNSQYFKSLPADKRHEILMDIKDTRKQSSWNKMKELPVESDDFSKYQMAGLLKRRQVQVSLEEAEKEMGGKNWSLSELESLLSEDGVIETSSKKAQKIAANENVRFLLVRDIAKVISEAKKEEENRPSTSKQMEIKKEELLDEDYDLELQKAIQMSLGHDVDDEQADEEEPKKCDEPIKLNTQQRKKFGNTVQTHGLVRGFMMEYAEMNDDDIHDMINETQQEPNEDDLNDSWSEKFPNTDRYVLYGTQKENQTQSKEESQENSKELVILVDSKISKFEENEDLFADVFNTEEQVDLSHDKKEDIPDVEVASIASSDDDTIEYEVPEEITQNETEKRSETEFDSGFVSEESNKKLSTINEKTNLNQLSENDKFWDILNDDEDKSKPVLEKQSQHKLPDIVMSTHKELHETKEIDAQTEKEISVIIENAADKSDKETNMNQVSENDKFWNLLNDDDEKSLPIFKKDVDKNSQKEEEELKIAQFHEDENMPQNIEESEKIEDKISIDIQETITVEKKIEISQDEVVSSQKEVSISHDIKEPQEKSTQDEHKLSLEDQKDMENALKALEQDYTKEELEQLQTDVKKQTKDFEHERNKLNRMGMSITQSMTRDCKELLKLFGIPYIKSPTEAEAQCAFLNHIGMIDGIITDDSDVWLFGAKTVYKNFFVQKKSVMEFRMDNVQEMYHLDRYKLIQLAMLVGSDYTLGLHGVGAVTALEILAAFPPTPQVEGETDQYQSLLSSLRKFRDWFIGGREAGTNGKSALKSKLKNVEIIEGFPSIAVMQAYLEPRINTSKKPFSWGTPDFESIVEYTRQKLGWTRLKTEEILNPVIKKLNEKKQTTIRDYFKSQMSKKVFDNQKMSKRVQKAVVKLGGEEDQVDEKIEKQKPAPRKRKTTSKTSKKKQTMEEEEKEKKEIEDLVLLLSDEDENDMKPPPVKKSSPSPNSKVNAFDLLKQPEPSKSKSPTKSKKPGAALTRKRKVKKDESQPSTSNANNNDDDDDILPPKRAPRIPDTKQVIPQKEREKEEQEKLKQKAIEIFKKSKSARRK
ncbi:hypothetical protein PVAND_006464 [Polypedilum vanderplanki]|uniref:Uncharacterized protein n=1 Tax=Polypedilum vanderplanki TaxID=319348 RepID=A0A9J6C412_POLVA|nr:hypothetical protein PVAND_006464 [Polypedilum vanderplanki]